MKKVDELDMKINSSILSSIPTPTLSNQNTNKTKTNQIQKKESSSSSSNQSNKSKELDFKVPSNHGFILKSNKEINKFTLFCQYPLQTKENKSDTSPDQLFLFNISNNSQKPSSITRNNSLSEYCLLYKAYKNVPDCITLPMINAGVIRTTSYLKANIIWKLLKSDKMDVLISKLNPYQRYNHFPSTWQIGRKDNLWKNFKVFHEKFPNDFNYIPKTYILPCELETFQKEVLPQIKTHDHQQQSCTKQLYIVKPVASSRGRGIKLLTPATSIPRKCLISTYIDNPHIINNKKYDLRLYVLITSFSPLRIYLYEEGLVRFATEDYDKDNPYNKFIHLTNYSINKESENFKKDVSSTNECVGSKWSLTALKGYFKEKSIDFQGLWLKIKDIITKTCVSIEKQTVDKVNSLIKYSNCLFELYGFDVLVDSNFNPWLMEVNLNPSLNTDTELDLKVKSMLMTDIFTLIGVEPYSHLTDKYGNKKGGAVGIKSIFEGNFFEVVEINKKPNEVDGNSEGKYVNGIESTSIKYLFTLKEGKTEVCLLDKEEKVEDEVNYSLSEFNRQGKFERVFPLKENLQYYSQFITHSNVNVSLWEKVMSM